MEINKPRLLKLAGTALLSAACVAVMALTAPMLLRGSPSESSDARPAEDVQILDQYDELLSSQLADARSAALEVKKVYWLQDEDTVAPEPDQAKYGSTNDPSSLQWLLDEAGELLDGQKTLFTTETEILAGTEVQYYLDDTILSIAWKQSINGACYNFNEVKIAHPSQLRRYLADDQYYAPGTSTAGMYTTTKMSGQVNAVCATNADFYRYRNMGIVVYNGQICRSEPTPDVCFIDDRGEMIMVRGKSFESEEALEKFVEDNHVRFSIAFGPILVEDYKVVVPDSYPLGEINYQFTRAALADMGDLHYLVVVNSFEKNQDKMPRLKDFATVVQTFGCEKAYTLDGGQTAIIIMNDKMFSTPNYGKERIVSDMIYFATAMPDGG